MKLIVLLFGVVLAASVSYAYPVGCEDEPEQPPPAVPLVRATAIAEEVNNLLDVQKANVIDPPKVCPDGQMLDHQGKCRPIMG
ncbi:AGAP008922-PA [Anopheles gambiae str. PEST]|uniref:AGAP008922-PA n=1 Tax=Anopheles gambiae TaxID=7165 RepID=Q7PWL6_ANOGA|nr:AGAP008922-PA [Anopheles gambiae str. PEST]